MYFFFWTVYILGRVEKKQYCKLLLSFLVVAIILPTLTLNAQQIDSSFINSLSKKLLENPDSVSKIAQNKLHFTAPNDSINKANLHLLVAEAYQLTRNHDSSLLYLDSALKYSPIDELNLKSKIHRSLGRHYNFSHKWKLAYEHFIIGLEFAQRTSDTLLISSFHLNLGGFYIAIGDYEQALFHYQEGLKICKTTNDTKRSLKLIWGIGVVYHASGEYNQTIEWYNKALNLARESKDYRSETRLLSTMADLQARTDSFNTALATVDKAICLAQDKKYEYGLAAASSNRGMILLKLGLFDKAEQQLTTAIKLADKTKLKRYQDASLNYLAEVKVKQNKFSEAEEILYNILELAEETTSSRRYDAYTLLSEIKSKQGNYKESLMYLDKAVTINDSLQSKETYNKISNLNIKYEIEEKQRQYKTEKQLIENEKSRQELFNIILSVTIFLLLLGLFLAIKLFNLNQKNKLFNINEEIVELRKKMLAQQLNPHFIFNNLNSIQYYIDNNDKTSSIEFLENFAELMKRALIFSQKDFISLEEEALFLNNYLVLEQKRLSNKFRFHIELPQELINNKIGIPPFLIQPSVENAIKHGISNKEDGKVCISFSISGNLLNCSVKDNGKGLNPDKKKNPSHKSMSQELTRRRLKIMNRVYKKDTRLSIKNWSDKNENGCFVEVVIPLIKVA